MQQVLMPALSFSPAARVVLGPQLVGVSSGSRHRARKKKALFLDRNKELMKVRGTSRQGTDESERGGWQGTAGLARY